MVQNCLSQPDGSWCHFNVLVVGNELQATFQTENCWWCKFQCFFASACTVVCEVLCFAHVNCDVVLSAVFANNHSCVHGQTWCHKQSATFLCIEQAVCSCHTVFKCNKASTGTFGDVALVGLVTVEHATHHAKTFGVGKQFATVANQATGRNFEFQPC